MHLSRSLLLLVAAVASSVSTVFASPTINFAREQPRNLVERLAQDAELERFQLERRTEFPDNPPSCKLCERDYANIQSCANASVVFSNPAVIMFAPQQFLDVIECACTDTFKSAYPQCVDCFTLTNQTAFLAPENGNLSSVVTGMREICGMLSTLLGGVASSNSQLPGQTPITVSDSSATRQWAEGWAGVFEGMGGIAIGIFTAIGGLLVGGWTVLV